jgi:hypothetical protein
VNSPPNRSQGPPSASGRPPASSAFSETVDDHREAAETVAEVLQTYGRLAFDTPVARASHVLEQCMQWALSATRNAPGRKVVLQGSIPPPRTDWTGLIHFFRDTRQRESAAVTRAERDLTDAIQTFARIFQTFLLDEQALDTRCAKALLNLSSALTSPADAPLIDAAEQLVGTFGQLLLERREQDGSRLRTLRQHVTQLEHSATLSTLHNPFEVDPVTGLHNRAACQEHLSFLANAGALFEHPPLLLLLRAPARPGHPHDLADAGTDAVLASLLDETFPGTRYYLARLQPVLFAVAAVAVDFATFHRSTQQLLTQALHHRVLGGCPLHAGLASNVPGELSEVWYRRAYSCADSADAFECVVAAAPAEFDQRA